MTQRSWFQEILIPTGDHSTYSELQNELDRRETYEAYVAQRARDAERLLSINQMGACAFRLALGRQGVRPRVEEC